MALSAPELMFEHGLDISKGWFQPAALDKAAKLSSAVTFAVPRGRVAHLDSNGEFVMGVDETGMGIFLLNGEADFDVNNPGTTPSGLFMHRAIGPTGKMSGVVASGGYEIQSTEADMTRTYTPGDLLTAGTSNTVLATGGVLTNAGTGGGGDVEQFVDPVCGVVSDGKFNNQAGVQVVAFWSVWLPGAYS